MLTFVLGRERGLSLAEIAAVFPSCTFVAVTDQVALVSGVDEKEAQNSFSRMGGIIKVTRVDQVTGDKKIFGAYVLDALRRKRLSWKTPFAIAQYHAELDVFSTGLFLKGAQKKQDGKWDEEGAFSLRLVNKANMNVNSAVYKKEKLGEKETEFNIVKIGKNYYFGPTIAYQDVDEYTRRDIGKVRDMKVGMMPPKFAQIMCNLARISSEQTVYDPFVGLGTILIEAAHAGHKNLLGSDFSSEMVRASRENIEKFVTPEQSFQTFLLDATRIQTLGEVLKTRSISVSSLAIVSEGYLGNILSHATFQSFSVDRERESLMKMYQSFFGGLQEVGICRKVVMTFPFWEIGRKRFFLDGLPRLFNRFGWEIQAILPEQLPNKQEYLTPRWSVLYRRPGQFVGRELYVLYR